MDAWKFVDYTNISPVFALGLTTEQWGLEPFPSNLVATSGYLKDIKDSTGTDQAWKLPFSCSSGYSLAVYNTYYSYYSKYGIANAVNNFSINDSVDICSEPQPCADSGCVILIEGIGRASTGPANSNIVGLSYAISTLLTLLFAFITIRIVLIMGSCVSSQLDSEEGEDPISKSKKYNPPPSPEPPKNREYFPPVQTSADKAKEIAQCSGLLREMYALDLIIWGMEGCVATEVQKREELKRKANALFVEIKRIIRDWKMTTSVRWTEEEWKQIEEIHGCVEQHDVKRYESCN
jgi:hypothetical protein